jgi:hypothetical protein
MAITRHSTGYSRSSLTSCIGSLVADFARAKRSQKRGGAAMRVTLVDDLAVSDAP